MDAGTYAAIATVGIFALIGFVAYLNRPATDECCEHCHKHDYKTELKLSNEDTI